MIAFEIRNKAEKDLLIGYLFYYTGSKRFYSEILSDMDEWNAPFIFAGHIKRGIYSIDSIWSRKFAEQRIIPPDRQNLGSILKENGLKTYDEFKLLQLSEGRCAQDDLYLVRISEKEIVPEIQTRLDKKVLDVMTLKDFNALVFFKDGLSLKVDIKSIFKEDRLFNNILKHNEIFSNIRVSPGGNGIEWSEERFISAEKLRTVGKKSDITYEDIKGFITERLSDTSESSRMLNCSRQYINQLVENKRLIPIRICGNTGLFPKCIVEREV
ncbi:MAG: DUF2442 domain-containing protein [Lachnospiraceae bacterium]|nr:DUF2442 domain-containing protein [Lachnospiraceae bacterium]